MPDLYWFDVLLWLIAAGVCVYVAAQNSRYLLVGLLVAAIVGIFLLYKPPCIDGHSPKIGDKLFGYGCSTARE